MGQGGHDGAQSELNILASVAFAWQRQAVFVASRPESFPCPAEPCPAGQRDACAREEPVQEVGAQWEHPSGSTMGAQ